MPGMSLDDALALDIEISDELLIIPLLLQENCQNYIRVMAKTAQGRLMVCGTNSFKPNCREYNVLNGNYSVEKEKSGQALCPYDPHHNSTAIYVGESRKFHISIFPTNCPPLQSLCLLRGASVGFKS